MNTLEITIKEVGGLIISAHPATLPEYGRVRAEREHRPWYLVMRPSVDEVGVTPDLHKEDELIDTYEI